MEGDNINAPLLSHDGSCMALSLFRRRPRQAGIRLPDAIVQASAIHLHVGKVSNGSILFSSLSTPSPFLSESNSPV